MTSSVDIKRSDPGTGEDADAAPAGLLRAFLAGRDVSCPNCEYNLRDLAGDRCPECGLELALRIQLAEPRLAAFLAGLVGLSAGAGFNALIFLYWLMITGRRGWRSNFETFIVVDLISLAVMAAATYAWLRSRRRLRTMSPAARWVLVAACWALTVASLLAFTFSVR